MTEFTMKLQDCKVGVPFHDVNVVLPLLSVAEIASMIHSYMKTQPLTWMYHVKLEITATAYFPAKADHFPPPDYEPVPAEWRHDTPPPTKQGRPTEKK